MTDALDVDLQDPELRDEIRLVAELMVAASAATQHLSQSSIDAILAKPAAAVAPQRGR